VGYQPTLATEMGQLQERITSTQTGSVTSVQAVYVPADDLTDPAPANTFAHLDAFIVLARSIAEKGIYPAIHPLDSFSRALQPPGHGHRLPRDHRGQARRPARVGVLHGRDDRAGCPEGPRVRRVACRGGGAGGGRGRDGDRSRGGVVADAKTFGVSLVTPEGP